MAKVWKNDEGKVILEDGRIVLCEDCPCDGECGICMTGTAPASFQVELDGLVDGVLFVPCTDCDELNGTYTVPAVPLLDDQVCGITFPADSQCAYKLCILNPCGSIIFCSPIVGAILSVCLRTNGISVVLGSIASPGHTYQVTWTDEFTDPIDCSAIVDRDIPLQGEAGNACFNPSSPTCRITAL